MMTSASAQQTSQGDVSSDPLPGNMFYEGSPNVGIGGLSIVRTMAAPEGAITVDAQPEDSPPVRWSIEGITTGELKPALILLGDLFVWGDGCVVGVTVNALLELKELEAPLDEDEASARGTELAQWATHLMYDFAALEARRALIGIGEDPGLVPPGTPALDSAEA